MKRKTILWVLAFVLLFGFTIWYIAELRSAFWGYQYRDEGGNIVFVTKRFDLIQEGARFDSKMAADEFSAGNGLFGIGVPGFVSCGSEDTVKVKAVDSSTCQITFPDLVFVIEYCGKSLKIGNTEIQLPTDKRIRITVDRKKQVKEQVLSPSNDDINSVEYTHKLSLSLSVEHIQ